MADFTIEKLNIDINTIPEDIIKQANEYYTGISRNEKFGSSFNFVVVLYKWYFVDKLEKSEIADIVGVAPNNVHSWLYNLMWNYSNDYLINKQKYQEECIKLNKILEEAKEKIKEYNFNLYKKYRNILLHPRYKSMTPKRWRLNGISSKDEYVKILFYLCEIRKERLSSRELAVLFGLKIENLQERVVDFDLALTFDKGIENKKLKKSQNYTKTVNAGKRTRKKALANSPTSGSKNEQIFRENLALVFDDYFEEEYYEVIVGVNNVGVLNGKEIDIPVLIYNNRTDKYIKIAVEYNGEIYHQDDSKKIKLLNEKEWVYYPVVETSSDKSHRTKEYLMTRAHIVASEIRGIVLSKEK